MIQQPNLCWRWSQFVVAMIASFTNAPLSRGWIVSIKLIVGVLWIAGASVFAVAIFGGIGWLAVYVIGLPLGFLVVSFLSWMFCVLLAKRYFVFSTCAGALRDGGGLLLVPRAPVRDDRDRRIPLPVQVRRLLYVAIRKWKAEVEPRA